MSVVKKACLIIYRVKEKGLEVFLVNKGENWDIPGATPAESHSPAKMIALDPVQKDNGQMEQAFAVEGDWHDIPSLRDLIKEDLWLLKEKVKTRLPELEERGYAKIQELEEKVKAKIPELEQGTYFAVKEAFKKVLPHQYAFLKELKDILMDRNMVTNI